MSKSKYYVLALGLILNFGLASCARDGRGTDAAAPPSNPTFHPPVVVRAHETFDLPAWDKVENKEVGLNDALDVGQSRAAAVDVTVRCGRGADEVIAHSYFEREDRLVVARLVPVKLLTRDLTSSPADCTFEVQLNNGAGARHGYLVNARVRDDAAGSVRIEGGPTPAPRILRGRHLGTLKIRYDNPRPAWARLVCENARIAPLRFDHVLDVSLLDLHAVEADLLKDPRQNCRFVIDESTLPRDDGANAHRTVVSNLVTVQFGDDPWWVESKPITKQYGPVRTGSSISIADVHIHNLDDQPHALRFPRSNYDGTLRVFDVEPTFADDLSKPWVRVDLETPTGPMHLDRQTLTVAPGESLHVKIGFDVAHTLRCYFSSIEARVDSPIFFEDVGSHGEIRASVRVPIEAPGLLKFNPEYRRPADRGRPAYRSFCAWD